MSVNVNVVATWSVPATPVSTDWTSPTFNVLAGRLYVFCHQGLGSWTSTLDTRTNTAGLVYVTGDTITTNSRAGYSIFSCPANSSGTMTINRGTSLSTSGDGSQYNKITLLEFTGLSSFQAAQAINGGSYTNSLPSSSGAPPYQLYLGCDNFNSGVTIPPAGFQQITTGTALNFVIAGASIPAAQVFATSLVSPNGWFVRAVQFNRVAGATDANGTGSNQSMMGMGI